MKKALIVGIVVLVLIIASLFMFGQKPAGDANLPTPLEENDVIETEETEYGFAYSYRGGDDGYVVVTPEDATRGNLVFTQSVFDTQAYRELQQSDTPREAPVSLTVGVYRNPMNLSAREWVTQTEASNYRLSTDGTISNIQIGGTDFLTYQFDGLYRADAYVYEANGYIYLFTNMWENPESNMKKDMEELLATLTWSTPRVASSVAHGDIIVATPAYNEEVVSPLVVEGVARGTWYFEASFPLVLVDWDGKIIAEGFAQAQDDWMTESFVPFKGELTFVAPEGNKRGALILKKDNPSGLPENDDAIEVPVVFKE